MLVLATFGAAYGDRCAVMRQILTYGPPPDVSI